jgi:nucleoside-diphosphate-sugar epimerase
MATLMESAWRLLGRQTEPPLTRQMLRVMGMPFTLNVAKARIELGYRPLKSWEQGLSEMRLAGR